MKKIVLTIYKSKRTLFFNALVLISVILNIFNRYLIKYHVTINSINKPKLD